MDSVDERGGQMISKLRAEAEALKDELSATQKHFRQTSQELATIMADRRDFVSVIEKKDQKILEQKIRLQVTEDLLFRILAFRTQGDFSGSTDE